MATSRGMRVKLNLVIGVAGFFGLMAISVLLPHGPKGSLPTPGRILAMTAVVAAGVAWWMVFAVRIFRAMDEFMQSRERVAWYWGGLVGLSASVPIYTFIGLGGLRLIWPDSPVGPGLARAFSTGYMLPVMMQVGGAAVVALWGRLARR